MKAKRRRKTQKPANFKLVGPEDDRKAQGPDRTSATGQNPTRRGARQSDTTNAYDHLQRLAAPDPNHPPT